MIKEVNYLKYKVKFEVKDPNEHIQKHWMVGAFYEASRIGMLNYIYQNYQGKTFVDIGASIGNHTIFFAKCCNARYVYAFEPNLKSWKHLSKNITLNKMHITPINMALGDKKGMVSMKNISRENIGMCQVDEGGDEVALNTLDSFFLPKDEDFKLKNIDIIKIDVEHYNIPLLRGAEKTLKKFKPDVFIECESQQELGESKAILEKYGYEWQSKYKFNHTPTYLFKWKQK